jgi:heat shock protein HslJ
MTEAGGLGPSATSDALAGTEWSIVRLDGQDLGGADGRLLLAFGHDGRVWGSTGVNELTASYSLTDSYVTFGPLATTRRSGTPEEMEREHRVVQSLAGMCAFALSAHTLTIEGPYGSVELVSTRPVRAPELPAEPADAPAPPPTDG